MVLKREGVICADTLEGRRQYTHEGHTAGVGIAYQLSITIFGDEAIIRLVRSERDAAYRRLGHEGIAADLLLKVGHEEMHESVVRRQVEREGCGNHVSRYGIGNVHAGAEVGVNLLPSELGLYEPAGSAGIVRTCG